jgi:hypothetical protein
MSFYSREVEPSHKEAPTSMDEDLSSESNILNQVTMSR